MIVVTTSLQLAKLLNQPVSVAKSDNNKNFKELISWLQKHHCTLRPTFPNISQESMQIYFELQCANEINEHEIESLRTLPGIDGAYRKSEEGLPQ